MSGVYVGRGGDDLKSKSPHVTYEDSADMPVRRILPLVAKLFQKILRRRDREL